MRGYSSVLLQYALGNSLFIVLSGNALVCVGIHDVRRKHLGILAVIENDPERDLRIVRGIEADKRGVVLVLGGLRSTAL